MLPLHTKAEFSLQILEKMHDLYCGKDTIYPIGKIISQQLYHPQMKIKFTVFNKHCPQSCINRALTLEERYKIFAPQGLGGSVQFSLTRDIQNRSNSVIVDLMGPYKVKCHTQTCTSKVWILLILNPATQFLSLEILENQSSAAIVSALIRHMAKHGSKNVFMSDMGSNFWPLATRYSTLPDSEIKGLPPMWKRLLTKDIGVLNSHGGYLWLLFSMD